MEDLLAKYRYNPDTQELDKRLHSIKSNIDNWMEPKNFAKCLASMDLTSLKSTDTEQKILHLVSKVNHFHESFPSYPLPASICVYPNLGRAVKEALTPGSNVHVTVVAGSFPISQSFEEIKRAECKRAAEEGADEIDIVLALNKFLAGDIEGAGLEIKHIREAVGADKTLKVILETGALQSQQDIAVASFLAMENGADFIKTSTGKLEPAATPMAAIIMCDAIKAFYEKTGKKVGFKPAGGIAVAKDAICYLGIVETILGKEWLEKPLFRLGASRLANNLLSELEGMTVSYY